MNSWARAGIGIVQVAIVLPLVLREFSAQTATLFFLLATIAGLLPLLSAGFCPTFSRFFAYARSGMNLDQVAGLELDRQAKPVLSNDTNHELVADAVVVGRVIFRWIGMVSLALLAVGGSLLVAPTIARIADPTAGWAAWGVVVISISIAVYGGLYRSYLEGMGYITIANRCGVVAGVWSSLGAMAVLLADGGIFELMLARQSSVVIDVVLMAIFSRRVEARRWCSCNGKLNPRMLRVSWRSAWRSGLGSVGFLGVNNLIAASSSLFAGFGNYGSFLFSYRILDQLKTISLAPFYSHLPDLQSAFHGENREAFLDRCGRRIAYSLWVFTGLCILIFGFGESLLSAIKSNTELPDPGILALLCATFFVQRYCGMITQVYTMSNHVIWHWSALIYGGALLILVFPLGEFLGIFGVVLAFFITRVLFSVPYLDFMLFRLLGSKGFRRLHRPIILPTLFMAFSVVIYLVQNNG